MSTDPWDELPTTRRIEDSDRTAFQRSVAQWVIPDEPGRYADKDGDIWTLDELGRWTDHTGETHEGRYAYILVQAAPFTRIFSK